MHGDIQTLESVKNKNLMSHFFFKFQVFEQCYIANSDEISSILFSKSKLPLVRKSSRDGPETGNDCKGARPTPPPRLQ